MNLDHLHPSTTHIYPTLTMSRLSSGTYNIANIGAGPAGCILARLLQPLKVDLIILESDPSPNVRAQGGTLDIHEETGLYRDWHIKSWFALSYSW